MAEMKQVIQINRDRYLKLLEDSAILRQIEFLIDQGASTDNFLDTVKDILNEMRLSRNEKKS